MKALITGGAGFIGSHLADHLLARGDSVILLDDLSTGRYENISHLLGRPDAEFVLGSILNADLVDDLMARARGATVFTSTSTGILSDGSIRGRLETAAQASVQAMSGAARLAEDYRDLYLDVTQRQAQIRCHNLKGSLRYQEALTIDPNARFVQGNRYQSIDPSTLYFDPKWGKANRDSKASAE